jgi:hypothetical protein
MQAQTPTYSLVEAIDRNGYEPAGVAHGWPKPQFDRFQPLTHRGVAVARRRSWSLTDHTLLTARSSTGSASAICRPLL